MLNLATLALVASHSVAAPAPAHNVAAPQPNDGYAVVDNHRDVPIKVFAETDWGEVDLGTVAPGAGRAFPLQATVVSQHEVDFRVVPKDQCVGDSGMIAVNPHGVVRLIVPPRWGPADHDKYDPNFEK